MLRRDVAMKVLHPLHQARSRARFLAEAEGPCQKHKDGKETTRKDLEACP